MEGTGEEKRGRKKRRFAAVVAVVEEYMLFSFTFKRE